MAIIPTQNKYPDRAGYLGLDTDRNVLVCMSDGILQDMTNYTPNFTTEGWVNVKDFGAKGDGVTDDTAVFQQCLGQDNVNIYIPNGTYFLSGTILIGNNINILGESWNTIILFQNSSIGFKENNKSRIKFCNFTISSFDFDKSWRDSYTYKRMFELHKGSDIEFNHINFENINGHAIYAYHVNNMTIQNCNFYNGGTSYLMIYSSTGRFMHNKMYADIDFENDLFVYQRYDSHMLYFDNKSENCGIGSTSTAGTGTFGLTYIIAGGRAILDSNVDRNPRISNFGFSGDAYDCKAVNNDFTSRPGYHCFWIESGTSKQHIISNNTFHTGGFGIGDNAGTNVIVSNNLFLDVDNDILGFGSQCKTVTFTNNSVTFLTEQDYAMRMPNKNTTDAQVIISNNRFFNAKAIIRVYNMSGVSPNIICNHLVTNNIIISTSTVPIGILHAGSTTLENCIENNNIFVQHTVGE